MNATVDFQAIASKIPTNRKVADEQPQRAERGRGEDINEMADKAAEHELPDLRMTMVGGVVVDPRTQYTNRDGTTVYNMLPSDPRMERIYGERQYQSVVTNTIEEQKRAAEERIEQLERKINMLMENKATDNVMADKQIDTPMGKMDYQALKKIARKIDPELTGGHSLENIKRIVFGDDTASAEETDTD